MTEPLQPTSIERFPCLQRVSTFLTNCGLDSYGMQFSWFNHPSYLFHSLMHPSNKQKDGLSEADEALLQQQEQVSLDAPVSVGKVFAGPIVYRLGLDQGLYRLSYSLVSTGRQQLICDLLAEKGITRYELLDEVSEGRELPDYQNFTFLEDCSGTVVTPMAIYLFWLRWVDGRHTLGESSSFQHAKEQWSYWHELTLEGIRSQVSSTSFVQELEGAQRRLYARQSINPSESSGKSEMWELREEDVSELSLS